VVFWTETWLSLICWAELLWLGAAGILYYIGKNSVKRNPDDYVYHFAKLWWATFKLKPSPIRAPRMIDVEGDQEGDRGALMDFVDEDAIAELGKAFEEPAEESQEEEAPREVGEQAAGTRSASLTVRVIPNSSADEVVGWMGKALKIRVTAAQEGGQANKSVIELLSSTLGLRPHQIQLKRGHYEEQKVLQISGITQSDLDERLSTFS
jgi:uncharacterized protein (TIGR00251 family)